MTSSTISTHKIKITDNELFIAFTYFRTKKLQLSRNSLRHLQLEIVLQIIALN